MNLPSDVLSLFVRDSSGQKFPAFMDDHQRQCPSCQALLPEKLDPVKLDTKLDTTEDKVKVENK